MPTLKVAVAFDAGYDDPTLELAAYRNEKVYPALRAKGFSLSQIQAIHLQNAIVAAVTDRAGNVEVDLITGSGHGLPESFHGWADGTIWAVSGNLPKGAKVIHLFACSTGEKLGPALLERERCKAFFGYNQVITVGLGTEVLEDVLECDGDIDRLLAEGKTAGEVFDTVKKKLDDRIVQLKNEREAVDVSVLELMRDALTMVGDRTASLGGTGTP
ncbi:MAG: hypothetical protein R3344_05000 [Acidobacteriota bacterium]|nr:hypothetical protein [Acidobacteriota bacterium]